MAPSIRQRRDAVARSAELLADHCTPWQLYCITRFNILPVVDSQEEHWAINPYARIQNVRNLTTGTWYCLTARDALIPVGDTVLGIKLMLEQHVEDFYTKAIELNDTPSVHPLADLLYFFLFEGFDDAPPFNEQHCCVEGAAKPEDTCDYHRGLQRGIEVVWYAANHLHTENVDHNSISYHIQDMFDANNGMKENLSGLQNLLHGGAEERSICNMDTVMQEFMVDVTEEFLEDEQAKKGATA